MKRLIIGYISAALAATALVGTAQAAHASSTYVYNGTFPIVGAWEKDTGTVTVTNLTAVDGVLTSGLVSVHATPTGNHAPIDCVSTAVSGNRADICSPGGYIVFDGVGTNALSIPGMSFKVTSTIVYGFPAPGASPITGSAVITSRIGCVASLNYAKQEAKFEITGSTTGASRYVINLDSIGYTSSDFLPADSPKEILSSFALLPAGTPISGTAKAYDATGEIDSCTFNTVTIAAPGTPSIDGAIMATPGSGTATINYVVAQPETVKGVEYQIDGKGAWLRPGGAAPTNGVGGSFATSTLALGTHSIQLRSVGFGDQPLTTVGTVQDFEIRPAVKPGTSPTRPSQGTAIGSTPAKPVPAPPAQPVSTVSGTSNGAGAGTNGALAANTGDAGIDAPCLAKDGTLYPNQYSTVGSQLTMAPNTHGMGAARSFIVTAGALPPGVQLDRAYGVLYGVTTVAGSWVTTVQATFADGTTKSSQFTTRVDADPQTLQYAAQNIGVVGSRIAIAASTNAPVTGTTYKIVCGELPAGTTFNSRTGAITGTPTTVDLMPTPLRVAESSASGKAAASFLFVVQKSGFAAISYPAHPHLRMGHMARIRPTVNGVGEIAVFRMWKGKLPRGLHLNATTGLIWGKPAKAGPTHTITLHAVTKGGALLTSNPMRISTRR